MILSIGEILADMICESLSNGCAFQVYCGGAPFNVAVNIKRHSGKVAFVGAVGRDVIGDFLVKRAQTFGLDYCDIQRIDGKNTTLAFVSLIDGERNFSFFRNDTADFRISINKDGLIADNNVDIVHIGSLMLSTSEGKSLADRIITLSKEYGKKISFDINYRSDLYENIQAARSAYDEILNNADIIKFSDDELTLFTGETDFDKAIERVYRRNTLLVVTLGSKGSFYKYNNFCGFVGTEKVIPVDTTGAGDAFFGVVLKNLDGVPLCGLTDDYLFNILKQANLAGMQATQHKGAI